MPGVTGRRCRTRTSLFVDVAAEVAPAFAGYLAARGIAVTSTYGALRQRWVTHLDVGPAEVELALAAAGEFFAGR